MVNDAYDYAMESYSDKPLVFSEIYDMETSEGSYEQYTTVIGPGKLSRSGESVTIPRVSTTEGFTVYCANFKYPVELPISNEAIDDNRKIKNFLKTWSQGLGSAARITQEDEHADIFNYGGFTAGADTFINDISGGVLTTGYSNKCYDSVCFINTSDNVRTAKSGLQYYNGVLSLSLGEANLAKLFQLLTVTNSYDEAGKRVEIMPDTLLVQYGSDNWFTARRIIESPSSVDGLHAGVTNLWKSQLRVIGWSALTDNDAWFLGCSKRGLKSLARLPLTIDYYEDKQNDGQVVRARNRYGRCVNNFRFWTGANFSQS
jgi:hypothetical protein